MLSLVELIHVVNAESILAAAPTVHVALPFMERLTVDWIQAAPDLRLIMQFGVGLEGVDVEAASRNDVAVSNIPATDSGNAQATAEHALFLSMSLLRHAYDLQRRFAARELGGLPLPRTVRGKRVTVVGYGAVGTILCNYLSVLGADVSVVRQRPWPTENPNDGGINRVSSLKEALPDTDLLILACPLTPETTGLVNDETLALLPRDALVVNVGRGPLVEHSAILKALESNHIGGYASDVGVGHPTKPSEPWDPNDELTLHEKTLFTPHVGGYCDSAYGKMSASIVDAIGCILRGEPPPVWVNRDAVV